MNCIYCQQPCHQILALRKPAPMEVQTLHWRCKQCPETHFRYVDKTPETFSIAIYFFHKETKYVYYEYRANPAHETGLFNKSQAYFYRVSSKVSQSSGLNIPIPNNINPQNVKDKFMTYVLFS